MHRARGIKDLGLTWGMWTVIWKIEHKSYNKVHEESGFVMLPKQTNKYTGAGVGGGKLF